MNDRASAWNLLRRASAIYDSPGSTLRIAARRAWRGGFTSGGQWMKLALREIRGQALAGPIDHAHGPNTNLQWLGLTKYAMAGAALVGCTLVAAALQDPLLGLMLGVIAFYVIEAQMVFLFPLALDGCEHRFCESFRWTARAGGSVAVLRVVIPLAAVMILGGLIGHGFVRSWCLGCLAVCIWYDDLRHAHPLAN